MSMNIQINNTVVKTKEKIFHKQNRLNKTFICFSRKVPVFEEKRPNLMIKNRKPPNIYISTYFMKIKVQISVQCCIVKIE